MSQPDDPYALPMFLAEMRCRLDEGGQPVNFKDRYRPAFVLSEYELRRLVETAETPNG